MLTQTAIAETTPTAEESAGLSRLPAPVPAGAHTTEPADHDTVLNGSPPQIPGPLQQAAGILPSPSAASRLSGESL